MTIPNVFKWYKTPSRVDIKQTLSLLAQHERLFASLSPRTSFDLGEKGGIPSDLTLERVLNNKTCTPMSLHDFHMYLEHIEHSPENLEFYLWFKDYEERWMKHPPIGEIESQEPPYTPEGPESQTEEAANTKQKWSVLGKSESTSQLVDAEKGTARHIVEIAFPSPSCVYDPEAPCAQHSRGTSLLKVLKRPFTSTKSFDGKSSFTTSINEGDPIELLQSYRGEIDDIVDLFLLTNSAKELNLPSAMRDNALKALATSTSPQHLRPIANHCYVLLKSCSHRNFVRLGVGNGTFETLCVATSLGIVLTLAGFLYMFCIAFATNPGHLHGASRWKGLGAFPLWWLGASFILSGARGSCFFLLLVSRRQPLPWERFEDDASIRSRSSSIGKFVRRMMIFDRKMRVKDQALKKLQRKIVLQSVGVGFIFAVLMCVLWIPLPIWK